MTDLHRLQILNHSLPFLRTELIAKIMPLIAITRQGGIKRPIAFGFLRAFVAPAHFFIIIFSAGPETVMEVFAKEPIKYTAEAVTLKGKLELNGTDINRLIYGLREVELVKANN